MSEAVPTVDELAGTREGTAITFNWTNPSPEDGDLYLWNTVDLAGDGGTETTKATTVTFQGATSGQVCIDVMLRRGDGRAQDQRRPQACRRRQGMSKNIDLKDLSQSLRSQFQGLQGRHPGQ